MNEAEHHRLAGFRKDNKGELSSAFIRRADAMISFIAIFFSIIGVVLFLLPYDVIRHELSSVFGHYPTAFSPGFWNNIRFSGLFIALAGLFVLVLNRLARKRGVYELLDDHLPKRDMLLTIRSVYKMNFAEWVLFSVILAITFGCRFYQLGRMLQGDEIWTAFTYARNPVSALLEFTSYNNHILFSFLTSLVMIVFGTSSYAIRLVDLLSGLILVPAVFFWCRTLDPDRRKLKAWLAAILVGLNPLLCEYSAQGRGYALEAVLALLAWILLERWLGGEESAVVLLGLVCSLALFLLPTSIFLVGGIFLCLMLGVLQKRVGLKAFIIFTMTMGMATSIFYAPAVTFRGLLKVYSSGDSNIPPYRFLPEVVWSGVHGATNSRGMYVDYKTLLSTSLADRLSSLYTAATLQVPHAYTAIAAILIALGIMFSPRRVQVISISLLIGTVIMISTMQLVLPLRIWTFVSVLSAIIICFGVVEIAAKMAFVGRAASILPVTTIVIIAVAYGSVSFPQIVSQVTPRAKDIESIAAIAAEKYGFVENVRIISFPRMQGESLYIVPIRYYLVKEAGKRDTSWNVRNELLTGELPWHKKPREQFGIINVEDMLKTSPGSDGTRTLFITYIGDGALQYWTLIPEGGKWEYEAGGFVMGWNVSVTKKGA